MQTLTLRFAVSPLVAYSLLVTVNDFSAIAPIPILCSGYQKLIRRLPLNGFPQLQY